MTEPSPAVLGELKRHETRLLVGAVLGTAALAWAWMGLVGQGLGPIGGGGTPAGARAGLGVAVLMWTVMTVAMMLPPSLPWIVTLARLTRGSARDRRRTLLLFLVGYAVVWGAFSVVAASGQVALRGAGLLVGGGALPGGLGGAVLMAVGVFQLTPVKAACLSKCRSPMGYFLTRWHDGPMGALRMGMGHGRFCLGCCWALMVAAFVLGVMNLAWMAVLTVVMCAEKLVPAGATLGRGAGWAALMIGAWLLATGWSL